MHLASVRQCNVHLEEENLAAQGKKQVVKLDVLLVTWKILVPGRNLLKPAASARKPQYSQSQPRAALDFDVSEDEPIEGCNLEEDNCFTEKFEQQDSIVLVNPDAGNEEEYLQKLMSTSELSDIREEKEEIKFRGLKEDRADYSYLFDNAETNNVLNEPQPNFHYEIPEDEHTDIPRYTLEQMEELFASFNDLII